jgi:hypothetical protein
MTFYEDTRPHPLGLIDNREWEAARARRADLYIAERARRNEPDHEPNRFGLAVVILAVLVVACALIGSVV